jgi:hypothetical protein
MMMLIAIWLLLLPIIVWLVLRWATKLPNALDGAFRVIFFGGLGWFGWYAFVVPNIGVYSRELQWRAQLQDYWFFMAALPLFLFLAAWIAARVNLRSALTVGMATLIWCSLLWGGLIAMYYADYGRSPFGYLPRSMARD